MSRNRRHRSEHKPTPAPSQTVIQLERAFHGSTIEVAAPDKPYLFSNIAGVLSYFGMDIHRGQAMTTPSHLVLDVFEFSDEEGFLRQNSGAVDEINRVLKGVVAGGMDVRALLRGRERSLVYRRRREVETSINLDNEHSRRHTVLEVVTDDAPGLLHRLSRVISDQGCDVDLVLISTEGKKAIDVFHITKAGAKLTASEQHALRADLQRMLGGSDEIDQEYRPAEQG